MKSFFFIILPYIAVPFMKTEYFQHRTGVDGCSSSHSSSSSSSPFSKLREKHNASFKRLVLLSSCTFANQKHPSQKVFFIKKITFKVKVKGLLHCRNPCSQTLLASNILPLVIHWRPPTLYFNQFLNTWSSNRLGSQNN